MRCAKVTQQLSALLDGELQPSEAEQIREHLASCADCRKEMLALELTISSVKNLPAMRAPGNLASRVLAGLEKTEAQPAAPENVLRARFGMRLLWPAAAALLVGVGIALLSPAMRGGRFQKSRTSDSGREVAMLRDDLGVAEKPAPEETTHDDYAFWAENDGPRQGKGTMDALRDWDSLETTDDESAPVTGFTLGENLLSQGKDGAWENAISGPAPSGDRSKEVGEIAGPAFGMQITDGIVEAETRDTGLAVDAIQAPRVQELEIRSEDPQAAYAKVAAISARFAPADKPVLHAYNGHVPEAVPTPRVLVLNLTTSQLAQIKKEIVRAGLVPTTPERLKRKLETVANAEVTTKGDFTLLTTDTEKSLASAAAHRGRGGIEAKKAIADSPADATVDLTLALPRANAPAEKAEQNDQPEMLRAIAKELPGGTAGGISGEPLIRVSISFIKTNQTEATATEIMSTDAKAKEE